MRNFFVAFQVDPQCEVNRFIDHAPVLTNFDDNRIEIDNRLPSVKPPILPELAFFVHPIGNFRNQSC